MTHSNSSLRVGSFHGKYKRNSLCKQTEPHFLAWPLAIFNKHHARAASHEISCRSVGSRWLPKRQSRRSLRYGRGAEKKVISARTGTRNQHRRDQVSTLNKPNHIKENTLRKRTTLGYHGSEDTTRVTEYLFPWKTNNALLEYRP